MRPDLTYCIANTIQYFDTKHEFVYTPTPHTRTPESSPFRAPKHRRRKDWCENQHLGCNDAIASAFFIWNDIYLRIGCRARSLSVAAYHRRLTVLSTIEGREGRERGREREREEEVGKERAGACGVCMRGRGRASVREQRENGEETGRKRERRELKLSVRRGDRHSVSQLYRHGRMRSFPMLFFSNVLIGPTALALVLPTLPRLTRRCHGQHLRLRSLPLL